MKLIIFLLMLSSLNVTYCATIAISCGAVGLERKICQEGAELWAKKTGHQVKIISTPNSSNERLALYQQLLAARTSDIDIFQIDVIWPAILGKHFMDLTKHAEKSVNNHFPALIENNTVKGRLVAMPWFTDAGMLYYRKDLLKKYKMKIPTTWEELYLTAKQIQANERKAGKSKFWGYVWQGRSYEGLTCNALEWMASYKAGAIVDNNGEISVNNQNTIKALKMAKRWLNTISPSGVLNYAEEDARGVFQSGNAAFMRNWPYAWSLLQNAKSPVKGKVGVVSLPKGGPLGKNASTLGGWQLAVSRYSKNPLPAIDLVLYLTSLNEQKRRALSGAYNPTIAKLYQDKEILKKMPFFRQFYLSFAKVVARPSTVTGRKYNQVSNFFWNAVHDVISGKENPKNALSILEKKLIRISNKGKW